MLAFSTQPMTTLHAVSWSTSVARPGSSADWEGRVAAMAPETTTAPTYTTRDGAPVKSTAAVSAPASARTAYPPISTATGERRSASGATRSATGAAGSSCATATRPAVVAPPRW